MMPNNGRFIIPAGEGTSVALGGLGVISKMTGNRPMAALPWSNTRSNPDISRSTPYAYP